MIFTDVKGIRHVLFGKGTLVLRDQSFGNGPHIEMQFRIRDGSEIGQPEVILHFDRLSFIDQFIDRMKDLRAHFLLINPEPARIEDLPAHARR